MTATTTPNVYYQGTPAVVSTDQPFTVDLTGNPTNPTTTVLWLGMIGPDGEVSESVEYTFGSSAMTNPSPGAFSMEVPTGSLTPGLWSYYYVGTGACAASPVQLGSFIIKALPT
jgi:hypothetical protein